MLLFVQALPGRQSRVAVDAPPAPVTRTNAHADQRRRILRAVAELVAERGYNNLTVELIVKRAHVSYKTFYKHFSGTEESFLALFDRAFESAERTIRERLDAEAGDWPEQVAVALRTWIELILADPNLARAVIVEAPTVGPGIGERYDRAIKAFAELFSAGRRLNPRGAELPPTIEEILAGSIFWSAYQRLIVGEEERLPDLLPELLELVLAAYLGRDEAARIARVEGTRELAAA
jgi:AcrR family transcriptional regulator